MSRFQYWYVVAPVVCLATLLLFSGGVGAASAAAPLVAGDESAAADSFRIAQTMVERGGSSVEAFAIAARQLAGVEQLTDTDRFAARAFRTLSMVSRLGGDVGAAEVFSRAAYRLISRQDFTSETAATYLAHALATRLSGRPGARSLSASLIEEALTRLRATATPDPRVVADLLQARANLVRATRDYPQAIDLYQQSLDLREADGSAHDLQVTDNECWLAWTKLVAGDLSSAEQLSFHCQDDLRGFGLAEHPLMSAAYAQLADIARIRGDRALATLRYRSTQQLLEVGQRQLFPGFSERRLKSPVLSTLAFLSLTANDPIGAWREFATEHRTANAQPNALAKVRQFAPKLAAQVQRSATASAHMSGAVEMALRGLDSDSSASHRAEVAVLIRYARQLSETLRLKNRLRQIWGAENSSLPSLEELRLHLRPSQAVVGFLSAARFAGSTIESRTPVSYAVVLRSDGVPRWVEVGRSESAARTRTVRRDYLNLMRRASEWPTRLPDDPRVQELLRQLYVGYLAPIEELLDGATELLLLPSALWSGFPFPALVDDAGLAMVDRLAIRHLSGIDDILAAPARDNSDRLPSLVLGDPYFDSQILLPNDADPTLDQALSTYANTVVSRSVVNTVLEEGQSGLRSLPRLQSSGWEARGIAAVTSPVILLTSGDATEQNVSLACGGDVAHHYRWVHLATHALIHRTIPERSALALSPLRGEGLLYVEEIGFGWMLDADLVTLSGCQTGGGPASWSEGPLGFLQALRTAGARNVLLSTEKVDDIATALLMERFYANLSNRATPRVVPSVAAPLSYSAALAEAQRWLRDLRAPDGQRPFAHPAYWANFRLIGSGGESAAE